MKKQYIFALLGLAICFVLFQNFGYWRRPRPRPTPTIPTQPTNPPAQPTDVSGLVKVYGYENANQLTHNLETYYVAFNRFIMAELSAVNNAKAFCANNRKQGILVIQVIAPCNSTVVNIANSNGESIDTLCCLIDNTLIN